MANQLDDGIGDTLVLGFTAREYASPFAQCPVHTAVLVDTFVQWTRHRASANLPCVTARRLERAGMNVFAGETLGLEPIASTWIFGDYNAVLVDAMITVAGAGAFANLICYARS